MSAPFAPGVGHNHDPTRATFAVRHYQAGFWGALTGMTPLGEPCDAKKRIIVIAHRRWGKDEISLHGTNIKIHQRPGSYWHCLPQFEQARKVVWDAVNPHTGRRRIDECFPEHTRAGINDTRMMIKFKNGSTWQLIGSDNYNSNVGSSPAGIVFSEWALANPAAWAYFRPMLQENGGWAVFITTPRGDNHAKRMFDVAKAEMDEEVAIALKAMTKDDRRDLDGNEWYAEHSGIYTTMALSKKDIKDTINDYKAAFDPEMAVLLFEQEYECQFTGIQIGSYWGRYIAQAVRENRVCDFDINENYPVHTAWDLGKAQNNPIWCFQVVDGKPRIVDFYQPVEDSDLEEWCNWLDKRGYAGNDYVPHDAMNVEYGGTRTRVDILREAGRNPIVVPRATFQDGIGAGVPTIKNAMFRNTPRVTTGLDGLKQFRREWDEEKRCYKEGPYKDWAEHVASAFRYLSLSWKLMEMEAREKEQEIPPQQWHADEFGNVSCNQTLEERVYQMIGETPPRRRLEDSHGNVRHALR